MKSKFLIISLIILIASTLTACMNNDVILKVEKEKLTKDELYEALKNSYGDEMIRTLTKEKILKTKVEITEKEIAKEIAYMIKTKGLKNEEELMENLAVNKVELERMARIQASEIKYLKKKANISEKEIETKVSEIGSNYIFNILELKNKEEIKKVQNLVVKGNTLENASQKIVKNYHYYFKWYTSISESEIPAIFHKKDLSSNNKNRIVELVEKDSKYYLYELVEVNKMDGESMKNEIIIRLASEKGVNLEDLYKDNIKKIEFYDEQLKNIKMEF